MVDGGVVAEDGGVNECAIDRDGDGFRFGPGCAAAELDCDDSDDGVFPGAAERCNGRDNDCDGEVDATDCECTDGFVGPCGSDVGECERGTRACANGNWQACEGGVDPVAEGCNGLDDDCDGTVDEGCPCEPGTTQPCGLTEGECEAGVQSCVDGEWSDCEGGTGPGDELCNGLDDDCDGAIDNDTGDGGMPCDSGRDGACGPGAFQCAAGSLVCTSLSSPRAETCNGLDDDCDGEVDEDVSQSCMGACGRGRQECVNGSFGDCVPMSPPPELCNGLDDDCDGQVDESYPEAGMACDTMLPGPCAAGSYSCIGGALQCVATNPPTTVETCDGVDNDCDGLVDEDPDGLVLAEHCGGNCPNGSVRLCLSGAFTVCAHGEVEICDGTDSNCDGVADNLGACYRRCPGGGWAVGTMDCSAGTCELPDEICGDQIDNDCDGLIDQNCATQLEDMVYVAGGTFRMGSRQNAPYTSMDETPIHTVELAPFYIDRYEVTREQYGDCVLAGQCSLLAAGCPLQLGDRQKPIVCVSWSRADDYCRWRGKRLPTEAEWEKAARGPFPREVLWPWGDAEDSSRGVFSCGDSATQCTREVDSFTVGRSYYGAHHMAGNAAEWVADFYDGDFYAPGYVVDPFNGTASGDRVVRGGSYSQNIEFGRVSNRATDAFIDADNIGFRCAASR